MQRVILFAATVVLLCSFSTSQTGQNEEPVVKAAQEKLQSFLAQIPPGKLEAFGFNSRSEFAASTIGKPYQLLSLNTELYNGRQVDDGHLFVVLNQWRVPVIVNGQQRMLLKISSQNGAYEAFGMGSAVLAAELQRKSESSNPEHQFYLLRIYPLEADFFVEAFGESFTDAKFYPLYSATMSMPMLNRYNSGPLSLSQVLPVIKDALHNVKN